MDILDIDEALKDDSYIFLGDKTHDDISNILQQWKTNNQTSSAQQQLQLQYGRNEQVYKLNSKTFTRPKRRSLATQNLDPQFANISNAQLAMTTGTLTSTPMLNLEIGGLVTNMHKSFLQDTSPPSSICSSMNNEHMNNSLITSADFTNLNFLQSTHSLESDFNLTTALTTDGYSLSDMIRDRKALESLTMSGDGTLIKDSQIGQIDDISLALSKTASGCSTMDNSTDSMSTTNECHNRTVAATPATAGNTTLPICAALQRTMVLSEEMLGDVTFNLVDSMTTPNTELPAADATFKRPLDETQLMAVRQVNTTYTEADSDTPETRCETPENMINKTALHYESTPLTTGVRQNYFNNNNKQYTPTLKCRDEVNLSPIVSNTPLKSALNNTYEPAAIVAKNASTASFDGNKFVTDTMELLEQIEQPLDGTYNMAEQTEQEQVAMLAQHKQMQCVMDLAEAEVELLAQQGDEEQFEHMLSELGKVNALNAEQLKMKKSLESIKRRFNNSELPLNVTLDLKPEELKEGNTKDCSNGSILHSNHSNSSSNGSGERLLSRRSRLYDDVNLSAMQASSVSSGSCNSTSFIVQRKREEQTEPEQAMDESCTPLDQEKEKAVETEATHAASYKLTERRERDRERFKTIKITKEMRNEQQEIIVPCIDDDHVSNMQQQEEDQEHQKLQQRLSRRERNNNSHTETANNYLTYKKPKEKGSSLSTRRQLPEACAESNPMRSEPRSLSRPRYISGLQKFTTVSKATSAGAGLNAAPTTSCGAQTVTNGAKTVSELKSPMGIKSKSFHNLSSNANAPSTSIATTRGSLGGLRRPGQSKLLGGLRAPTTQQTPVRQEEDTSVFKVPKLVSGLRAPAHAAKRAVGNGLARPSSGYYSLSVAGKEAETPESLSSASSRGSLYGKESSNTNGAFVDSQALTSKLTQVTVGATGIPKPSGLRPPTQMKRSALPRPSSVVRR